VYHTIEFAIDLRVTLARSPGNRLQQLTFRVGDRLPAEVRPYVVETEKEPVEVADLVFADGSTVLSVPFLCFSFID
jgi:hypothetical protein